MPFTPSHALVALPFVGTPLVPAAIAIGSMTPDVPLFFRFGPDYWLTHSWLGALVVDLPLALGLLLVWRLLLRPAVPQLTPRWFAERWPADWCRGAHPGGRRSGVVRMRRLVLESLRPCCSSHHSRWA